MTDIKLLIERVDALENRVQDLENQLAAQRNMTLKSAVHPMEAHRESISRSSPSVQSKHMQSLKEQLLLKNSS